MTPECAIENKEWKEWTKQTLRLKIGFQGLRSNACGRPFLPSEK
jgi:hypothetical protein